MCDKAVREDSFSLQYVPDWFVTLEQVKSWHDDDDYCNDAKLVEWYDHIKTQEMCNYAVRMEPHSLEYVPDRFKTKEMYHKALNRNPHTVRFVPDHLKTGRYAIR